MVITGIIIVVATFIAIIKQFETRLVLFLSGLLMCFIGGNIAAGTTAFVKELTNAGLVPTICTVLGFSYVMEYTKCTEHMVYFISAGLKRMTKIIIPGAVIITFLINIALPTAAGCAAAVGALLIPALIRSGVHPAMAGSAVFLGTWGSSLSPGLMFNPQVAQLAGTDVMTVIASFTMQAVVGLVVAAILLNIVAIVKKEHTGYVLESHSEDSKEFKVNYLYAIIPIIPLVLLVLGSKQVAVIPEISVPVSMLIGTAIGIVAVRPNVTDAVKKFFRGTGDGMCDVVGLMAAAACFTAGMQHIGLTSALIDGMKNSQQIAQIGAAFGPFLLAVISGSGNAAALAFNGAVTPHAADFGYGIMELGSMAQLGAGIGRSMSPVAGAGIIIAGLAGINPMELAKRNAVPCVAATVVIMLLLL
ncbi:C4-dicarboxylate ABC transporter [Veillonella denticariosi JCM 15641]|uniref:C4-dicarboxylate ABC transporter n=1 Tax=Veillonella denticariosi JCM 15641 TaxID=1298594 RepID=A0A2S7ZCJ3_9FIRM|nr:C4-dicarboxylate transporter DcuC [Veillonella denticariosi]PQL20945.1 C4-dicarboxylate ABC transporter [Veillonella denticariosi JCM 15641]